MVIKDIDYRRGFRNLEKRCRELRRENEALSAEADRLSAERQELWEQNAALADRIDELDEQGGRDDLLDRLHSTQLALQRVIRQNTCRGKILEAIKLVMQEEWILDTTGTNAKLIFNYKKHLNRNRNRETDGE